ncbi:hypothetical protein V6Z05_19905 [Leptospira venezuelensis]|uniref:hypothetical protein n=1 Tax=Leptospira venezuelensis TaxID=1958811 RepID=UPI000A3C839C|nr:hypothetical protein [Leptospira venezuelensis]
MSKEIDEDRLTKLDPWEVLFVTLSAFLNDLDCIGEMVSLVLPVLQSKDEERSLRIKEVSEEIQTEKGQGIRFKSFQDIKEFASHIRKMRRGDMMFRQAIIITIVSKYDEFFSGVLRVSYEQNPGWLKNVEKKISYKDVMEIVSLEAFKDEIIYKEIESLMRDSHFNQISFIDTKLKLGIIDNFPFWKDFLEITERRNLFAHTGGTVSSDYINNCKKFNIPINEKIKEDSYLSASDLYIKKSIDIFYELAQRIVQASVRRLFPDSLEEADKSLNNKSVDLLIEERWGLAERMFQFAMNIPEVLVSKGEMKYYFLINLCIALKYQEKPFEQLLHSIDWTPFHPKYHFAIAVLENKFELAETLMKSPAVREELTEQYCKEWPLLREFRNTEGFLRAFKEIYNKDFSEEIFEDAEKEIKTQQDEEGNSDFVNSPLNE